jgi:hypothetical protein
MYHSLFVIEIYGISCERRTLKNALKVNYMAMLIIQQRNQIIK